MEVNMFAVYNNGSVGFRSTADNLYELKNLEAPNKVSLKPDDDDLFQEYMTREQKQKPSNQNEALDIYKKIANMATSEQIFHVKDIMTKEVVWIEDTLNISQAYDKLRDTKINQIPVFIVI